MRLKKICPNLLAALVIILLLGKFTVHSAFADSFTLSGQVKDSSGNSITGATVTINDSTTTDGSGNYSLTIPQGTYNVQVTPPSGSNYTPSVAMDENISSNTVINFIRTP